MDKREHATPSNLQYIIAPSWDFYHISPFESMIFPNFPCVWCDMWSFHGGYHYHVLMKTSRSSLVVSCLQQLPFQPQDLFEQKKIGPWIILPLWSTIHHPGISYDDSCCHKNLIGTQIQKERVGYSKNPAREEISASGWKRSHDSWINLQGF